MGVEFDKERRIFLLGAAGGVASLVLVACSSRERNVFGQDPEILATRVPADELPHMPVVTFPESTTDPYAILGNYAKDYLKGFGPDCPYKGETNDLGEGERKLTDLVQATYGIKVISPLEWKFDETEEDSVAWPPDALEVLLEALQEAPPAFLRNERRPVEILIVRRSGVKNNDGGVGGSSYSCRVIVLMTAGDFSPDKTLINQKMRSLYGTQGNHLIAATIHELGHRFLESSVEVFKNWIVSMGWVYNRESKNWMIKDIENLPHPLCKGFELSGKFFNPQEDFCISAGLLAVNPLSLAIGRRRFFKENPSFRDWQPVQLMKI